MLPFGGGRLEDRTSRLEGQLVQSPETARDWLSCPLGLDSLSLISPYFLFSTACAAASRAIGTRKGEQLT